LASVYENTEQIDWIQQPSLLQLFFSN